MLTIISLTGLVVSSYVRKVLIAMLVCLELVLLSSVLAIVHSYLVLDECLAQSMIAFIITLAGAETSCALALIVNYYQHSGHISIEPTA
jgi:NADH:ubiquinone oxidoreductase subunit K